MPTKAKHNTQIRMDKDLHSEVKRVAKLERRNVSEQIHVMLQEAIDQRKSKA